MKGTDPHWLNDCQYDPMDNPEVDVDGSLIDFGNEFYFKPSKPWKARGLGPCPKCGEETELRSGKFGKFYGCTKFPECKGSRCFDHSPEGGWENIDGPDDPELEWGRVE